MAQGQRPEYEELDDSMNVTALALSAHWHQQMAIKRLTRANQLLEERATKARGKAELPLERAEQRAS